MSVLDSHLGDDRLRLADVGARGGVASRWQRFWSVLEVTAFEPDQVGPLVVRVKHHLSDPV